VLREWLTIWFANSHLLQAGGWIIGVILLLTFIMWVLILKRYLVLRLDVGKFVADIHRRWIAQHSNDDRMNARLRGTMINGFRESLSQSLGTIQVITAVLPLLGLLGTVAGMIETFSVMTVFGSGNVRGMAGGISQALITTMAGLVTALTGVYFASDLEHRINTQTDHLSEHLVGGDDDPDRASEGEPVEAQS